MTQIPVAAVRAIIRDEKGLTLLLRRPEGCAGAGQWCLPGGKVDYGQTVEEALIREIDEETTLQCTKSKFLFYQDSAPIKPDGMQCINFYFRCEVAGEIELNSESSEYAWVASSDLSHYDIAFGNDEGISQYLADSDSPA